MDLFKLGWDQAMEIVHLEHWVQFMDDKELEMWYREKLNILQDNEHFLSLNEYQQRFLEKDVQTLALEIHKRKFSEVLYNMKMNIKLLQIMDQMEVYYMYHPDEPCPDLLKRNVKKRIAKFMKEHNDVDGKKLEEFLLEERRKCNKIRMINDGPYDIIQAGKM